MVLVDLTEADKVQNGCPRDAAWLQHMKPFTQDFVDFAPLIVFENVAVVSKIDSAIAKKRTVINRRDVINMRIVDYIDMDDIALSAAKV